MKHPLGTATVFFLILAATIAVAEEPVHFHEYRSLAESSVPIKAIVVDVNDILGNIPQAIGVNCGPHPCDGDGIYLIDEYRDVGVKIVRTHDFYGPTDWYTIFPDPRADPEDPASYDFALSDKRILPIVAAGAEIMFRFGISWGAPKWTRRIPVPEKFKERLKTAVDAIS